ncbi:MAG TPA: hypothetical protein VGR35_03050 [Tepidisphaeraceae bacterium]|nr:hypothetical protein [Tepidisphaeraceae bacterium]
MSPRMSPFRMMLVSALALVIVAGHLVDAWKQKDHWPFAAYPMFARVNKPEPFTSEELWGVTPDGREIPVTSKMTGIMGTNRIRPSLFRLYRHGQRTKNPKITQDALLGLLRDYEQRRQRREHDGPQLIGMRFYQLKWDFDWWAKNRDAPQRAVLFEVHS